jgi:hypothetical protein
MQIWTMRFHGQHSEFSESILVFQLLRLWLNYYITAGTTALRVALVIFSTLNAIS